LAGAAGKTRLGSLRERKRREWGTGERRGEPVWTNTKRQTPHSDLSAECKVDCFNNSPVVNTIEQKHYKEKERRLMRQEKGGLSQRKPQKQQNDGKREGKQGSAKGTHRPLRIRKRPSGKKKVYRNRRGKRSGKQKEKPRKGGDTCWRQLGGN